MKYISIIEPATKEAIRTFAEKRNLMEHFADHSHPQEDYLIASPPTFVVSDGVTLNFKKLIETNTKYPDPSPAGDVARVFCEAVIESAKRENDTTTIFKEANIKVAEYNTKVGASEVCGNPTGFYSATGAFVIAHKDTVYWTSICDSFVIHLDKEMNTKFMSTGVCRPYAVINGEERMAEHLEKGIFDIESGDFVFVLTDGFEYYVRNQDFLKLFLQWDETLTDRITEFSREMNLKDPEGYGHERSLIAINF